MARQCCWMVQASSRLTISVAATSPSGQANEDVIGFVDGLAAWVIDGATGVGDRILPGLSDAAWFANTASESLRAVLLREPLSSTQKVIREVIESCAAKLEQVAVRKPAGPHEQPSAAFAMVRLLPDGSAEMTTLGDCRVIWRQGSGAVAVFGETGLADVESLTLDEARLHLAANPDISPADLRYLLLPRLRENRRLMNVDGGYWVLGTDPEAARHLDTSTLSAADRYDFAIASDGFLRLCELYDAAAPADLLAVDDHLAFSRSLELLRTLDDAPRSLARFPRVKVRDDASFIRCRLEAGR